jgi:hypothetical protein
MCSPLPTLLSNNNVFFKATLLWNSRHNQASHGIQRQKATTKLVNALLCGSRQSDCSGDKKTVTQSASNTFSEATVRDMNSSRGTTCIAMDRTRGLFLWGSCHKFCPWFLNHGSCQKNFSHFRRSPIHDQTHALQHEKNAPTDPLVWTALRS